MASSDSDDTILDLDSCFKGSLGLRDSMAKDPTTNDLKKKKKKSAPSAEPSEAEELPEAKG